MAGAAKNPAAPEGAGAAWRRGDPVASFRLAGAILSLVLLGCERVSGPCPTGDTVCPRVAIDTQVDASNCGRLGEACFVAHGTPACSAGICEIVACEDGWADCDGEARTGCETDVRGGVENCGGCGRACRPPHGLGICAEGACELAACDRGWSDCDGLVGNGCETRTGHSPEDCGACGIACAPGLFCVDGACELHCELPWTPCDPACVDLRSDPDHCGRCGRACRLVHAATAACEAGACAVASCEAGWGDCDGHGSNGCETDLLRDPAHCGRCGNACVLDHATAACRGGACTIAACDPGWEDCDGDRSNGCEVDLQTDAENCGACGRACRLEGAVAVCRSGTCEVDACRAGRGDCDGASGNGCETDTLGDPRSCGRCGTRCPGGSFCVAGACKSSCPPPRVVCGALCVDLSSNNAHCGACDLACELANSTAACVAGFCAVDLCRDGWGDCDAAPENGCETSLRGGANCGACGYTCPSGYRCVISGLARHVGCAYWPESG